MRREDRTALLYILKLFALAIVYFGVANVGLSLAFRHTNISPVWPPTGLALASLLLLGYRYWPAIAAGAFFANFVNLSVPVAFIISAGNTLEALCGAYLIRRLTGTNIPLHRADHIGKFFFAAVASTLLSATIGTTAVYAGGFSGGTSYWYLWWTWLLGDSVGDIVFAPLILTWISDRIRFDARKTIEGLLVVVATLLLGFLVFGPIPGGAQFVYLTIPFLVVATFRFRDHGATGSLFLLSIIAIWGTGKGDGPFQMQNLNESLLFLEFFIGSIGATSLILAAVLTERSELLNRERNARNKVESTLREKEVLLQEIHHRVKNNLQVISSLLNLQARNLRDQESLKAFQECNDRIRTIALIHEKLYQTDDFSRIRFSDYIQSLTADLMKTYQISGNDIHVTIISDDVVLDVEKAVPLGLITNELVFNSLKHAFPNRKGGGIKFELKYLETNRVNLRISDDGIGLPPDYDLQSAQTLGLKIVNILVGQLEAVFEVDKSKVGTCYSITFAA